MIVGYGSETINGKKVEYWIVQNSWGTDWGEKGFIRVERGKNLCQINSDPRFPVLKNGVLKALRPMDAPELCRIIKDIFNKDGVYVKSICISKYNYPSYSYAQDVGTENGMRLYTLSDLDVAVKGATNQESASASSGVFKILYEILSLTRTYQTQMFVKGQNTCSYIFFDTAVRSYKTGSNACKSTYVGAYEFINVKCNSTIGLNLN